MAEKLIGMSREELQEIADTLKPFTEFIAGNALRRAPDDIALTAGSGLARKQVTLGEFRAAERQRDWLLGVLKNCKDSPNG